jgi:hypothetical protein
VQQPVSHDLTGEAVHPDYGFCGVLRDTVRGSGPGCNEVSSA